MHSKRLMSVAGVILLLSALLVSAGVVADDGTEAIYEWRSSTSSYVGEFRNTGTGYGMRAYTTGDNSISLYGESYGSAATGMRGYNDSTGYGTYGRAVGGYGAYGETNSASATYAGVYGKATSSGTGVRGTSASGTGAYLRGGDDSDADLVLGGNSNSVENGTIRSDPAYTGSDLLFYSNDEFYLNLDDDNNEDATFSVFNGENAAVLVLNEAGDLTLDGDLYLDSDASSSSDDAQIYATAANEPGHDLIVYSNDEIYFHLDENNDEQGCFKIKNGDNTDLASWCEAKGMTLSGPSAMAVPTSQGDRAMYATASTGAWFEDFGSAALVDGRAKVQIDPLFAETVNLRSGYHVYLTPLSSIPVLLSVSAKAPHSFEVVGTTLDGKPAACNFDYRIVARQVGHEDADLDAVLWEVEADFPEDVVPVAPEPFD